MSFIFIYITCVTLATLSLLTCHKRGTCSSSSVTLKSDNPTMYQLNQLTNFRTRKLLLLLELSFLKDCREEKIFPNFIQKNCPKTFNGFHLNKRITATKQSLLRAALKDTRSNLARNELHLYRLHSELMFYYHPIIWNILDKISWAQAYAKEKDKKTVLKKKFSALKNLQKPSRPTVQTVLTLTNPKLPPPLKQISQPNVNPTTNAPLPPPYTLKPASVINLSNFNLNNEQSSILNFGLNYAHNVPPSIFLQDLICSTDFGISRTLNYDVAIVAKHEVKSILQDFSAVNNYNSYNLIKALAKEDVYILKSDKGNNTVLINKPVYDSHLLNLLQDTSTYTEIKKDPINKLITNLKSIVAACTSLASNIKKKIVPSAHNLANFYGLPKLHKPNLSFRPIVSKVNSITYPCAKYVSSKIKFLLKSNKFTVQNSTEFVSKLKNIQLDDSDLIISLDVTSLYTSVPTNDAINCLEAKLKSFSNYLPDEISDLLKLTTFCVKSTYFKFRSLIYKQTSGLSMGCPLSSTLADIFMDGIDDAINRLPMAPSFYVRYVDDIFIIWKHNLDNFTKFVENINLLHPAIKFTTEMELNKCLPFLDVLVSKDIPNKCFTTSVYRKPNSNSSPPHFKSAHPMHQKLSAFKGFVSRAYNFCSTLETRETELNFLRNLATSRGFNSNIINKFCKKIENKLEIQSTTTLHSQKRVSSGFVIIPYIPGLSGKIGAKLRKYDLRTIYKPYRKTADMLNTFKNKKTNLELSGIYSIPCADCPSTYIGQTKRNFKARKNEHVLASGFVKKRNIYDSRKLRTKLSAVAVHRKATKHSIDWSNAKIIKSCPPHLLNINEQLHIYKFPNNMNKKEDQKFPVVWKSLIKQNK